MQWQVCDIFQEQPLLHHLGLLDHIWPWGLHSVWLHERSQGETFIHCGALVVWLLLCFPRLVYLSNNSTFLHTCRKSIRLNLPWWSMVWRCCMCLWCPDIQRGSNWRECFSLSLCPSFIDHFDALSKYMFIWTFTGCKSLSSHQLTAATLTLPSLLLRKQTETRIFQVLLSGTTSAPMGRRPDRLHDVISKPPVSLFPP